MSPNHRLDVDKVNWLEWLRLGWMFWLGSGSALPEHAIAYLDSG